ncbi:MAG: hypothetical protein FGF48_04435 [Candidatus Brockarchaeota archaeon]|nr:hypothetical protein [Candidatus Brockarchaeota archaeon]
MPIKTPEPLQDEVFQALKGETKVRFAVKNSSLRNPKVPVYDFPDETATVGRETRATPPDCEHARINKNRPKGLFKNIV